MISLGEEVKSFCFSWLEPMEKECLDAQAKGWVSGNPHGLGGWYPGYMRKPEPHTMVGEVVSWVPHVEGHRQTNLGSSGIKYLIQSFSSQPSHSLMSSSGKFVMYNNRALGNEGTGRCLCVECWREKLRVPMRGRRSQQQPGGMEILSGYPTQLKKTQRKGMWLTYLMV